MAVFCDITDTTATAVSASKVINSCCAGIKKPPAHERFQDFGYSSDPKYFQIKITLPYTGNNYWLRPLIYWWRLLPENEYQT